MCNQRRHGTSKAHQATTTNQDRRERHYNDDATTTQVGRGSRRFSGMFWKASSGFKQSLRRHLRFWKLSENCPITFREDSENQIQLRCTASSLQDLYRQDDGGRRSSRSGLNPPAPRLRAAKYGQRLFDSRTESLPLPPPLHRPPNAAGLPPLATLYNQIQPSTTR